MNRLAPRPCGLPYWAATISKSIRTLVLLAAGLDSFGCAPALLPSAFEGGGPEMRPEIFFAGATSSSGVLENRSGAPTRRFHVKGLGQALPDGSFRLDQSVTFGQDAPEMRTWVMQRIGSHNYTATLTDASGAVEGQAYGDLFHLCYPMKTPFGGQDVFATRRSHGNERSDCPSIRGGPRASI